MNKQILLVCQGRSGSTTLLRIMNLIDGCNICGENWNMVGNLLDCYSNLKKTKVQPGYSLVYDDSIKPAWYNVFDFEEIQNDIKKIIVDIYKGNNYRVWGFKEIRFGLENDYPHFERQLNDFKELFPETKIIFLYREDIERQSRSDFWAENINESKDLLLNQLDLFKKYNLQYSDYTFILSLENMLSMNNKFIEMFEFLEEKFDINSIKIILDHNQG